MSKIPGPSEFEKFTTFFDLMGVQYHISDYEMREITRKECIIEEKSKKSGRTMCPYRPNPLYGKEILETMQVCVGQSYFIFDRETGKFIGVVGDECGGFWPKKETILLHSTPHPEGALKKLWDNAAETVRVTFGKIGESFEKAVIEKGFENVEELQAMVTSSSIDLSSSNQVALFKQWASDDRTKKGLVKLIEEIERS